MSILDRLNSPLFIKGYKVLVFVLLLVLLGSFLFNKITLPGAHDLPRQIQNGKDVLAGHFEVITKNYYSYTEPEQSFANHHWLYGVFAYILHESVGWDGMVLFKVLFILFTFILLFKLALKKADFWLVAFFAIPTIFILIGRTALRPEIFSYFFVVVFLYLLLLAQENPKSNKIFWLIPLQIIWVNTHLFFPVGVMLIGGMLFQEVVLNIKNLKQNAWVKKLSLAFLGVILAIFLNAYGLLGAIYSLRVNTNADFPIGSAEIDSIFNVLKDNPGVENISAVFFLPCVFALLISFLAVFIKRWKRKEFLFTYNFIFLFFASLGSALLGAYVARGLPLFGLMFLLAITTNLNEMFLVLKIRLKNKYSQVKNLLQLSMVCFFIFALIGLTLFGQRSIMRFSEQGIGLAPHALGSAQFFKENNLQGPIFNDTDIGSYLIGEVYPKEKVFADNRFGDAYSSEFFSDTYLPMLSDELKWEEGLAKYNFNTIFFYHYDGVEGARDFLYKRIYDPKWAWVYADNYAVILVRNTPENQQLILNNHINFENIAEKLKYLSESNDYIDELAAADIFNLTGRTDLSIPLYYKIVSKWPERGKIWMVLGRTELTKVNQKDSNPYVAAILLERAIKEGWKTWETYSYLALAYQRTGQFDRLKEAVRQELKIDPENLDGKKWLGIIAEEEIRLQNIK